MLSWSWTWSPSNPATSCQISSLMLTSKKFWWSLLRVRSVVESSIRDDVSYVSELQITVTVLLCTLYDYGSHLASLRIIDSQPQYVWKHTGQTGMWLLLTYLDLVIHNWYYNFYMFNHTLYMYMLMVLTKLCYVSSQEKQNLANELLADLNLREWDPTREAGVEQWCDFISS